MSRITLTKEFEAIVQRQLDAGYFSSEREVIEAALLQLDTDELAFEKWLKDEIPRRYNEYLADPSQSASLEDVRARFESRFKTDLADTRE